MVGNKLLEVTTVAGNLHSIHLSSDRRNIVALTLSPCTVITFNTEDRCETNRIKIDMDKNPQICWVSPMSFCSLAIGESSLRLWNIECGEYYDLT